jgi:hypothetical protein
MMRMYLEVREILPCYNHFNLHNDHILHNHNHNHKPPHNHKHHLDGPQHEMLVDVGILMQGGHQMQDNQKINGVLLDVTTGQILILLRMGRHSKHVIIAELPEDVVEPISMQQMLLFKGYNNQTNRKAHQITQSTNLLIHHHPNNRIYFSILLFLQRIITA